MSQQLRRNKISINLSPNNYYIQLPKSQRDARALGQVTLAPMQIKKVEIFKSYEKHLTDVVVEIDNLDPNVAVLWSEGKYIAELIIGPASIADTASGFFNYFACYDMKIVQTPAEHRVYSTIPTVGATVILKSITRTRLEAENNFPFELGGKNGKGAAGVGQTPIQFMHTDFMEVYNRNYMEEGDEANSPWTMTYCDLIEPIHQVHTTPANGFRMITDTNFQALEFFFKHYPAFNTTFDWLLDDCSTAENPTEIRISDFTWWEAWEPFINIDLSNLLNKTIDGAEKDPYFVTAASLRFFRMQKIEHLAFHDWVVFYVKNGYPKIWAVDVSSGKPIPMTAWNAIHEEAPVLTPSGNIKIIKNPMYQEYLTFMTTKEITQTQLYKNVFQNLHPLLEKFTFSNVVIGEVDIQTIVEFKLEDSGDTGKYDRLGMGYQVLHTYTREDLQPPSLTGATSAGNDSSPYTSQFSYSHSLETEMVFLTIDKGDLTLPSLGKEDANNVSSEPSAYNLNPTDNCAGASDSVGNDSTGGGGGGTDGAGIPGNTNIADQGQKMIDAGFNYQWGGKKWGGRGIDCSGFTSLAVKRAGIGNYPHGTANQRPWCARNGQRIKKDSIAKGDILFFSWSGNGHFGHTGIAISGTQYIHSSGGRKGGVGAKTSSFTHLPERKILAYRLKGGGV